MRNACLQVYPIEGFPDQDICDASKTAIQNHLLKYSAVSRILQQVSRNKYELACIWQYVINNEHNDKEIFN